MLSRDGRRWGKREIIPHCRHQNDSCIKMGSDERHFNVSFIVRIKVTRQCPQTTTFFKSRESRRGYRSEALLLTTYNALPLGQTGSHSLLCYVRVCRKECTILSGAVLSQFSQFEYMQARFDYLRYLSFFPRLRRPMQGLFAACYSPSICLQL